MKRIFFVANYDDLADPRVDRVRDTLGLRCECTGFFDPLTWANAAAEGEDALRSLIDGALGGTTSTCVLIGAHTFDNRWARYAILKSVVLRNPLVGLFLHGIPCRDAPSEPRGANPFEHVGLTISGDGSRTTLWERSGTSWTKYDGIDGTPNHALPIPPAFRGLAHPLSTWCPTLDWPDLEQVEWGYAVRSNASEPSLP